MFIRDRKEGFWNRTLLANVSLSEILISHTIFNSILMLCQVTSVVVLLKLYFADVVVQGSETVILLIMVLTGYAGLFYGLMISCYSDELREILYLLIGKNLLLSLCSGE